MATRTSIFATNDVLTANDLNSLAGAWNSYTPSVSNVTTSSATGRYIQFGKLVMWNATITVSAGPTGEVAVGLPVAAATSVVMGKARLSLGSSYDGVYFYNAASSVLVRYVVPATGVYAALTASLPATWSSGHIIQLSGIYEAA